MKQRSTSDILGWTVGMVPQGTSIPGLDEADDVASLETDTGQKEYVYIGQPMFSQEELDRFRMSGQVREHLRFRKQYTTSESVSTAVPPEIIADAIGRLEESNTTS